jgi:peptidoglycan/xylan/chitin deacetylase (PgdA/CDA1 family)
MECEARVRFRAVDAGGDASAVLARDRSGGVIESITLLCIAALVWAGLLAAVRAVRGPAAGVRRMARLLALAVVAVVGVWWVAFRLSNARRFQLFGEIVPRVETDARTVALTFDDGPTPAGADSVLAVLREEAIRATFFLNGADIARYPAAARRIVLAGHEIGNHTWDHPRMLGRAAGFTRAQIERTDSIIRSIGYTGPIHFRPPYGKKLIVLPWVLARSGRTTVTWDVDPDSYSDVAATADGIVAHVRERVRPGSIVLLHVMFPSRATSRAAVRDIIRALRTDGYAFVTVSELLAETDPIVGAHSRRTRSAIASAPPVDTKAIRPSASTM